MILPPPLPLAVDWPALSVTRRLTCQSAEQHHQAQGAGAAPLTQFPIQRREEAPVVAALQGTQAGFLQGLRWNQI